MVKQMNCPFCNPSKDDIVFQDEICYTRFDKYPVSKGHLLIIPFEHFSNYFETTFDERISILNLLDKCKEYCNKKYNPDGYNIGINVGRSAGQTVLHLHIHLIPRYSGDMIDPSGGVRGVIPDKMKYYEK